MTKGKKIVIGVGTWFLLGVIASVFIVLFSPDEKNSTKPQVTAVEEEKPSEPGHPEFKKESGLTDAEKFRNPLIVNHVGNMRVITNMRGERLGIAQVIRLSPDDFDSITAKNLKDFWLECNFDGWMFVWILEKNSEGNTGRGMVITGGGSTARYGYMNADEKTGIEFGKFYETVREFFYLSDEKDFQYFNSYDSDEDGLKRFKNSDLVFAVKIN